MNKIYITDEQEKIKTSAMLYGLIRRAIGQALRFEQFGYNAEISVTLTDDEGIRQINAHYRNKDAATDVLSFPLYEDGVIDEEDADGQGLIALGDIVISLERAETQSKEYGHSFEREVAFLCVHSVLHLLGYDHELGQEQEKEMFSKQEQILQKMKLTR